MHVHVNIATTQAPIFSQRSVSDKAPSFRGVTVHQDLCWEKQEMDDFSSAGTAAGHPAAARQVRMAAERLGTVAEKASSCGAKVQSVARRTLLRFRDHAEGHSGSELLTAANRTCVSAIVSAPIHNTLNSQDLKTKTKFTARAKNTSHVCVFKVSGRGETVLGLCLGPTAPA